MNIKIGRSSDDKLSELDIQRAFEKDLARLEDGLTYVASFLPIGTGIIDTLAIDDENNLVIIEFKKAGGDFDEGALIQLMNYYSWFVSDENHLLYLKGFIKKIRPEIDDIGDIRLMAVISKVSDRVKNACWAMEPSITLVTYSSVKEGTGDVSIVPNVIVDTSVGGERLVREPKTEEEHLRGYDSLRPVYQTLKKRVLEEIDSKVKVNPTPQDYIALVRKKMFCAIHMKKQWIRLDLLLTPEETGKNPRYIQYGSGPWGYTHVRAIENLDPDVMNWIRLAYEKAG